MNVPHSFQMTITVTAFHGIQQNDENFRLLLLYSMQIHQTMKMHAQKQHPMKSKRKLIILLGSSAPQVNSL
jgi:hypothetical protein